MSEVLLPPWIVPEKETQELLDEGSSVFRAAFAPGLGQRQSYGGLRLKLSRKHTVRAEEKAVLLSILRATKGSYNTLRTKVHFALRGSFPTSQLLPNNTFANGTTDWASTGPTFSVVDRVARFTRNTHSTTVDMLSASAAVTVTQYAPYVARSFDVSGRGNFVSGVQLGSIQQGEEFGRTTIAGGGMKTLAAVIPAASVWFGLVDYEVATNIAGDYYSVPYTSLSRCALVDNGQNLLLRSEEYDNAAWTKTRCSATANIQTDPIGTATADRLVEDATASNSHYAIQSVTVASAAADYAFSVALKAGTRTHAVLGISEATTNHEALIWVDLNVGSLGTSAVTGANWSNIRTFIRDLGGGWYQVTLVARKVSAATTLQPYVALATADAVINYSGDGTSYINVWRATLAQSSVPTRLVQTTSTATTGISQTGSELHLKGLPASTSGLLLPEDCFEINGEIKHVKAALNSDAAGLGYLQFEPGLVRSPADNDPVIVTDPMAKFLVSNIKIENEFGTQAIVTYDLEHIYE